MNNNEIWKKLRYKTGRALVLNAPEEFDLGVVFDAKEEGKADFALVFVRDSKELKEWLPKVLPLLQDDAVCWLTYPKSTPKQKTDINRDSTARFVQTTTEFRVVSNIAIDDTWSALRIREKDKVK